MKPKFCIVSKSSPTLPNRYPLPNDDTNLHTYFNDDHAITMQKNKNESHANIIHNLNMSNSFEQLRLRSIYLSSSVLTINNRPK